MKKKLIDCIAYYTFKLFPGFAAYITMFYLSGAYRSFGYYQEDGEMLVLVASDNEHLLTLLQQGALTLETRDKECA